MNEQSIIDFLEVYKCEIELLIYKIIPKTKRLKNTLQ